MCLYPKLIKNRKYLPNKKNEGNPPKADDIRKLAVPVGCGKCMECLKKKAREWQVRLSEEIKTDNKGIFVTLSFSDEALIELQKDIIDLSGYELENEIATLATRRFLERWRKKHKKSVKHWLITELGHNNTERIHLHGIIFTEHKEDIDKIWKYGNTWLGDYVNQKTINYIVKYVTKTDQLHKEYKSKILTSKGIGKNYINTYNAKNNKYKGKDTNEAYTTKQGYKLSLPIYYRNQIYSEEEREQLWVNKLDEEVRWVDGTKIDVSNGDEEYYKALKHARTINKRLGYGDDSINWERRKYENQRRELLLKERINRQKK